MALLPDQVKLLERMVEGARGVPRTEQEFMMACMPGFGSGALGKCSIEGPGLASTPVMALDVWRLVDAGYLDGQEANERVSYFVVSAGGFEWYEARRDRPADPVAAVEEEMTRYIDADSFRQRHPQAHARLRAATELLWQSSPEDDLTTIGHALREALQRFATELVDHLKPAEVDPDPARTKNRLTSVVDSQAEQLGDRRRELLRSALDYQEAVNGVVQRLEHADQKQGDPATWDDARSACYQTINVMVELDRLLRGPDLT